MWYTLAKSYQESDFMKATATEVQNNFGKYLKFSLNENVIITRNGKEIACLSKYDPEANDRFLIREGSAAYSYEKPIKATYEEFLRLVEDSRNQYEYIKGIIYLMASPSHWHQVVSSRLYGIFFNWFNRKQCKPLFAPYDVNIPIGDENNTVQPDILVICDDEEKVDSKGKYQGIPSLVVEVLSPSTKSKDMSTKLELYMKGGVNEFWIVDMEEKEVYVYTFRNKEILKYSTYKNNDIARSLLYEGLEINIEGI
jgi:Uma2 family endonuclease